MPGRPAFDAATAYRQATAALAERDPVLRRLIGEAGPPDVSPPTESHLAALVRAIVYQQLAGAAASAIHGRLIAALDGEITPERILALLRELELIQTLRPKFNVLGVPGVSGQRVGEPDHRGPAAAHEAVELLVRSGAHGDLLRQCRPREGAARLHG